MGTPPKEAQSPFLLSSRFSFEFFHSILCPFKNTRVLDWAWLSKTGQRCGSVDSCSCILCCTLFLCIFSLNATFSVRLKNKFSSRSPKETFKGPTQALIELSRSDCQAGSTWQFPLDPQDEAEDPGGLTHCFPWWHSVFNSHLVGKVIHHENVWMHILLGDERGWEKGCEEHSGCSRDVHERRLKGVGQELGRNLRFGTLCTWTILLSLQRVLWQTGLLNLRAAQIHLPPGFPAVRSWTISFLALPSVLSLWKWAYYTPQDSCGDQMQWCSCR